MRKHAKSVNQVMCYNFHVGVQPDIILQYYVRILLVLLIFLFLVNCSWDEFSSWTTCTKTCGGGTQVRQRQVKVPAQFGGEACEGGQAEQRVCNEQGCPSTYDIVIEILRAIILILRKYHYSFNT